MKTGRGYIYKDWAGEMFPKQCRGGYCPGYIGLVARMRQISIHAHITLITILKSHKKPLTILLKTKYKFFPTLAFTAQSIYRCKIANKVVNS